MEGLMKKSLPYFLLLLILCVVGYFLLPITQSPAQFTSPSAGGGTSDSLGVDTDGDGTTDNWLYSTAGAVATIKKGANITLTVDTDTVTIAGPAASGTADSLGIDTDGDGAVDSYLYSTVGASGVIRKGERITLTVAEDTVYINSDEVVVSDSSAAFADSTDQITHGNIKDWHVDFGTGSGQVSSDDVTEGSSNLYDQLLPDSSSWSTAYSWGNHAAQNYLDDDVGQDVDGDDVDSTEEDFVFNDAYRITSEYDDSMFMTKGYIDAVAGGLTPQSVKGDHVDSTSEDFVFNDAYRITSAEAGSMLVTKGYVDISDDTVDTYREAIGDSIADHWGIFTDTVEHYREAIGDTISDHWAAFTTDNNDYPGDSVYNLYGMLTDTVWATKEAVDDTVKDGYEIYQKIDTTTATVPMSDDVDTTGTKIAAAIANCHAADDNDYPGDSVNTVYGMLTDTTWDMKNGFVWSGAHEFTGGTPSLEIPNATAPATDAEGEISWDSNDDAIEVYSGDESESVLLPIYYDIEAMVFAPDGVNDYIPIFHADALLYPHGIEIDQLSITLPTSTNYTLPVHEVGSDHAFDARIDSLVVSSAQYLEDGSPMDGNLDADDYIYLNIPSTDVDWVFVKIIYHVTEGD